MNFNYPLPTAETQKTRGTMEISVIEYMSLHANRIEANQRRADANAELVAVTFRRDELWDSRLKVLAERDEAREIAGQLYRYVELALKAFNAEPFGEEQYQQNARVALFGFEATLPTWMRALDAWDYES